MGKVIPTHWIGKKPKVRASLMVMTIVLIQIFTVAFAYWHIDYQGMVNTYVLTRQQCRIDNTNRLVIRQMRKTKKIKSCYTVDRHLIEITHREKAVKFDHYTKDHHYLATDIFSESVVLPDE